MKRPKGSSGPSLQARKASDAGGAVAEVVDGSASSSILKSRMEAQPQPNLGPVRVPRLVEEDAGGASDGLVSGVVALPARPRRLRV